MKEDIRNIILQALMELNEQLNESEKFDVTDDVPIFGRKGKLDSLDFVNLVIMIEDKIFQQLSHSVTIVSEKAFSRKYNPFESVEKLTGFIVEMLEGEK